MADSDTLPAAIETRGKSWTLVDPTSRLYRRTWSTNYGSNRYGPCEVCRKGADTVWCADFAVAYPLDAQDALDGRTGKWGLTQADTTTSLWGHRECVEAEALAPVWLGGCRDPR